MLTIIQSRCWRGFQQTLKTLKPGHLVATPPDLTFQTFRSEYLPVSSLQQQQQRIYCIQTNIVSPHDTFMIAREYGKLLQCGTYLMDLETHVIVKKNLIETDGSPTIYLR